MAIHRARFTVSLARCGGRVTNSVAEKMSNSNAEKVTNNSADHTLIKENVFMKRYFSKRYLQARLCACFLRSASTPSWAKFRPHCDYSFSPVGSEYGLCIVYDPFGHLFYSGDPVQSPTCLDEFYACNGF